MILKNIELPESVYSFLQNEFMKIRFVGVIVPAFFGFHSAQWLKPNHKELMIRKNLLEQISSGQVRAGYLGMKDSFIMLAESVEYKLLIPTEEELKKMLSGQLEM